MKKLLLFLVLISNFGFSQENKPFEIKTDADYKHKITEMVFPKEWNSFKRKILISYDADSYDIGATYELKADKKITTISVYLYVAEVSNDNLRDQFLSFQTVVDRNSTNQPKLKPEFVKLKSDKAIVNGIKSFFDYNLMIPDFMKGQKEQINKSMISIYDCGKWNLKFRITSENFDNQRLAQLENALQNSFNPLKLAEENHLQAGRNTKIIISKTAQRDSLMVKSTIAEAEAKRNWLDKNKTFQELSTGFSDFEVESHEFAINEKLKFYKENKDKLQSSEETKNYFEFLQKIVNSGFLKDYIFEQTFGIISNYEPDEKQNALYFGFKNTNNFPENIAELMYRIHY